MTGDRDGGRRRPRGTAQRDAEAAFRKLLESLGARLDGELRQTPARAAGLWSKHLLAGEGLDPGRRLGQGSASSARGPVTVAGVGVHLVCPHHLTVAFGEATVAYLPQGRVAGFSALARLIHACTARLVLQEDACSAIAETLVERLHARAAVARIDALHPCHNVPHGRSHRARAVTWGASGDTAGIRDLMRLLDAGARDASPAEPRPGRSPRTRSPRGRR